MEGLRLPRSQGFSPPRRERAPFLSSAEKSPGNEVGFTWRGFLIGLPVVDYVTSPRLPFARSWSDKTEI